MTEVERAMALCEAPPSEADADLAKQVYEIARKCAGDYNYPDAEILGAAAARLLYLASLPIAAAITAGKLGTS